MRVTTKLLVSGCLMAIALLSGSIPSTHASQGEFPSPAILLLDSSTISSVESQPGIAPDPLCKPDPDVKNRKDEGGDFEFVIKEEDGCVSKVPRELKSSKVKACLIR